MCEEKSRRREFAIGIEGRGREGEGERKGDEGRGNSGVLKRLAEDAEMVTTYT